jgi:hypothetical protein
MMPDPSLPRIAPGHHAGSAAIKVRLHEFTAATLLPEVAQVLV